MPSTNFIMTPSTSSGSASTKSITGLRIGSPKKAAARRFITLTKERLTGSGEGYKRLRILTRYPVDGDLQLHRNTTLPEVVQDKRSDSELIQKEKPPESGSLLRVSSYPEINLKRNNSTVTNTNSENRQCKSETKRKERIPEDSRSLKLESDLSHLHSLDRKHRKREDRIIANVTIIDRNVVTVKSIAQSSSRTQLSVKHAINRYIAMSDRRLTDVQDVDKHSQCSDKILHESDQHKNSKVASRKLSRANSDSRTMEMKKKHRSKSSDDDRHCRKYFKPIKPSVTKIISESPACIFKMFGPILLSAPHGLKLWRGGTEGRRKRIHYREIFITEIVLRLSAEINKITGYPASFIIWDRRVAMPGDFKNLDPNYLTEKQFPNSPFHEALVLFKKYGAVNNFPIMHIDVHGKKNRKTNMDLDIGFRALENHWPNQSFVKWLKSESETQFENAFNSPKCEKNDMRFTVNVDPSLCGDWGGDLFTMTCQSVTSGVPAFQLEIPRAIRGQLIEDSELMNSFAQSIVNIYNACINGGRNLHINVSQKERDFYQEYLEKVCNDHLKIDKTFPEKQI